MPVMASYKHSATHNLYNIDLLVPFACLKIIVCSFIARFCVTWTCRCRCSCSLFVFIGESNGSNNNIILYTGRENIFTFYCIILSGENVIIVCIWAIDYIVYTNLIFCIRLISHWSIQRLRIRLRTTVIVSSVSLGFDWHYSEFEIQFYLPSVYLILSVL